MNNLEFLTLLLWFGYFVVKLRDAADLSTVSQNVLISAAYCEVIFLEIESEAG